MFDWLINLTKIDTWHFVRPHGGAAHLDELTDYGFDFQTFVAIVVAIAICIWIHDFFIENDIPQRPRR